MKIIYNNVIPFKGFKAINLFGILFVRKGCKMNNIDINHEKIHSAQMKELLYIPFYIVYFIEWLIRFLYLGNFDKAYRSTSFEVEAYCQQYDLKYLKNRKHYQQWK